MNKVSTALSLMSNPSSARAYIEKAKVEAAAKKATEAKKKFEKLLKRSEKAEKKAAKKFEKLSKKIEAAEAAAQTTSSPEASSLAVTSKAVMGTARTLTQLDSFVIDKIVKLLNDDYPAEAILFEKVAYAKPITSSEHDLLVTAFNEKGSTPFSKAIHDLIDRDRTHWVSVVQAAVQEPASSGDGSGIAARGESGVVFTVDEAAKVTDGHQHEPLRPVEVQTTSSVDLSSIKVEVVEEAQLATSGEPEQPVVETPMRVAFSNAGRTKVNKRRGHSHGDE